MSIQIGDRQVKELYIGVNGQPRKVTEGYVGVNGVPRRFYSAAIPLSSFEVGSLVYIIENGVLAPYIVSGHEYDESFTEISEKFSVLVRQEPAEYVKGWVLDATLTRFCASLDPVVQTLLESNAGLCNLMFLSMLGLSLPNYFPGKLQELPNASTLKMCDQWLGDTRRAADGSRIVTYRAYTSVFGSLSEAASDDKVLSSPTHGFRPSLSLPGETKFDAKTGELVG